MADPGSAPAPSVYPDFESSYRYEDAPPQIPREQPVAQNVYQEQGQPATPVSAAPSAPPSTGKSKSTGEVKPRLRKACDSCSIRKVKVCFAESCLSKSC